MAAIQRCPVCGQRLEPSEGAGRPRTYCEQTEGACREVVRLENRLTKLQTLILERSTSYNLSRARVRLGRRLESFSAEMRAELEARGADR